MKRARETIVAVEKQYFALEEAMKAQTGSIVTALLFL